MRAVWNGTVIAQSQETVVVDGNHYFPEASVDDNCLSLSETTSVCSWKGTANYYSLVADGKTNEDAAWVYKNPKDAAMNIKNHLAFWRGVEVIE